ncbi:sugar ABC transporter substrate-binding protein [Agrococcus versicolor]|uniref:Sugar ABC transporter substrate-binding protein n=1 Tax=Agrococcus versicolor TaxID=501482 RepID=A0ABP5MQE8_9MICO
MARTMRRKAGIAALAVTTTALAGCAGFGGGGGGDEGDDTLSFTTWASESEQLALEDLVAQFEDESGATVELNVVPYEQMFSNIDAQLASGDAPDVFRVDYGNLGVYSSQEQLLDLSDAFSGDEVDAFTPALWEAVSFDGAPYGVPHQTDVSALIVNLDMLAAAGIDASTLPTTQDDAWTWEEFADVAAQLRTALPAEQYPFVVNWQQGGTPRWMSWLFQAGGSFMAEDGTPTIDSPEGAAALDFTRSFFENQWVPPTSTPAGTVYADSLFSEQTTAMAFVGSFLVPDMDYFNEFEWTALPMPRDERGATDLGGNALVATAETDQPELATEFLRFMVTEEAMSTFCAATNELPTLTALEGDAIEFAIRPDVMPVFVDQATTIEPEDVRQLTSPAMAEISVAMQRELEAAFVNGQSTEETLANLDAAIAEASGS